MEAIRPRIAVPRAPCSSMTGQWRATCPRRLFYLFFFLGFLAGRSELRAIERSPQYISPRGSVGQSQPAVDSLRRQWTRTDYAGEPLVRPTVLLVTAWDQVWVVDTGYPSVVRWSVDGEELPPVGRVGVGPGEYRRPSLLVELGDSVGVWDRQLQRMAFFDRAGTRIDDTLLKMLAMMRSDGSIQPLPTMQVDGITIDDRCVAVVQVEPSRSPPVRFDGRVWIRVGPTVQQATMEDELRLVERRRASSLSFDRQPFTEATVDHLDLQYIEEVYLPSAIAADVLAENRLSLSSQMESLGLLVDGRPTRGALLTMAHNPQIWVPGAYVQFLRFNGTELADPIRKRNEITGKLVYVLRRVGDLIDTTKEVSVEIVSASQEVQRYDYPPTALVQLVCNAIMHRCYESNAPVRIYWFDDRIDIQSPGGVYGKATQDNIEEGVTDYRNPLVVEIMYHLGFAQCFGVGIPIAKEALRVNGSPPLELRVTSAGVTATVRPRLLS